MLPPDDTSPSNIIEILVANHQAKHTHTNKTALDEITTEKIAEWDNMGNHTHDEYITQSDLSLYAKQSDLDLLEDVVATKAASTHSHAEYASVNHSHEDYVTQISLDTLSEEVNGKADSNHTHDDYADVSHIHAEYAESSHTHTNKALLDTYTQTEENLADAVAKKHEHANANELAKIAEGDKAKWDAMEQNAKDYTNTEVAKDRARLDAVEAKANANEASIADKADADDLTALTERVTTAEANIASNTAKLNSFVAISEAEIAALFE